MTEKLYNIKSLELNDYPEGARNDLESSLKGLGYTYIQGQFGGAVVETIQGIAYINIKTDTIFWVLALNIASSLIYDLFKVCANWWKKYGNPEKGKPIVVIIVSYKKQSTKLLRLDPEKRYTKNEIKKLLKRKEE